ncbi:hypothetical protein H2204_009278 [Knufia peltigerae]|uniref:2-oxoisovalerate dehydrogenase subunit alpha n=1 Tax=Knufia peltigerae TaxID=1002370 RepID=A0AA38XYI3_9EURO|nr:hypothetical protein H2204_009278 [Knufia peltigerae]
MQSHFPGAPQSPLTTGLHFTPPAALAPIPVYRVLDENGKVLDETGNGVSDITDEEVLIWYRNMLTVNILDSIMFEAQRQGRVSFYMVSAGEEAVTVGSAAALGPRDIICTQYREHGVFQQRGFTLKDFMSQLFATHNDPGKGRNMPNHYSGRTKVGVHAVASTLGTQIPHAVGAAYALKLDAQENPSDTPSLGVVYFGEGAASEGDFHGAMNLASVKDCPVLFMCRNNGLAISTPTNEQYRGDGIASRAIGYGMETIRVDGTDIFAVYKATKEARRKALERNRPILLEFMSYRVSHHSTSDDSFAYRKRGDVETWKLKHNPISRLGKWLEAKGIWDEDLDKKARSEIRREVLQELAAAEKEKKPTLKSIWTDVYAELSEEQEEQRIELRRLMTEYPAEYDVDGHAEGINGL